MKVLVAEDDEITRTALVENLKAWGYEPVAAVDGQQAWDLLQDEGAPRLVLLDWVMPLLSGIQICRRLRRNRSRASYIIILTGKMTTEDLMTGFQAGADDYVTKPFNSEGLRARLQAGARVLEQIDQTRSRIGQTLPPDALFPVNSDTAQVDNRILVAEDDPVSQALLLEHLADWGYDAMAVEDGAKALKVLKGEDPPSLVVLDQRMPSMTGTEVCRRVRNDKDRHSIYILMLTALGQPTDVVAGFEAGADDYIVKPFSATELRARIEVGMRLLAFHTQIRHQAFKAEKKYSDIFENALDGIYQVSPQGRFITANPSMARIYGFDSPEKLKAEVADIGRQVYMDPQRWTELKRRIDTDGRIVGFESLIRRKDGTTAWVSENARAVREKDGRITCYEGFVEDITPRKATEDELYRKTRELEAINTLAQAAIKSLNLDTVAAITLDKMIDFFQPAIAVLFQRQGDDLHLIKYHSAKNKIVYDKTHVHRLGQCLCGLAARDGKGVYSDEIHKDPRCTWSECKQAGLHSFAAVPLLIQDRVIGVIGMGSDTRRAFELEKNFIESAAATVALSLQNAILFEKVRKHGEDLEQQVAVRTAVLEEKTSELERFNRLFVDREFRIKELKDQVAALRKGKISDGNK